MKTQHSNRAIVWTGRLVVAGGLLAILWSANGFGKEAPAPKQPTWDDYKVIVNQNMFSKNRKAPEVDRPPPPPVIPANPESFYILRGITSEDGVFLVFLQDNKQGGVLIKRVGEEVARGKIKSVLSLDTIEYQMGETTKTIQMGYDLEGGKGKINISDLPNWKAPGGDQRSGDMRGGGGRGGGGRNGGMQGGRNRQQDQFGNRNRGMGGQSITRTPTPSPSTSSSSGDTLAGDPAETLRRLMERRQQQLGQPVQPQPAQDQPQPGQDQPQPAQDQPQPGQGQQQSGQGQQ